MIIKLLLCRQTLSIRTLSFALKSWNAGEGENMQDQGCKPQPSPSHSSHISC